MSKAKTTPPAPNVFQSALEKITLVCQRKNPAIQKGKVKNAFWKPASKAFPIPLTSREQFDREFYLQEKGHSFNAEIDTEYQPRIDASTLPLLDTICNTNNPDDVFARSHPDNPNNKLLGLIPFHHNCFIGDWLENLGHPVESVDNPSSSRKRVVWNSRIFHAGKDIEFIFKNRRYYHDNVIPLLAKMRRLRSIKPIFTGVSFYKKDGDGKMRWFDVYMSVDDISASQGAGSLLDYTKNVGIVMDSKETYTKEEKGRMLEMQIKNQFLFEQYGKGDTCVLTETDARTVAMFNKIAKKLGVARNPCFGKSLGRICAGLLCSWLEKELNLKSGELVNLVSLAGSDGILTKAAILKLKKLNYTAMVDGGRCVKERAHIMHLIGLLFDIDIKGCYGNGIKNQIFAVGNPFLLTDDMYLKDFIRLYGKELVDGLWTARIRTDIPMPFEQDLFISKEEKAFKKWSLSVFEETLDPNFDPTAHSIDASMIMAFRKISGAVLTSDFFEVMMNYFSDDEIGWLKENLIIESALIYRASDRVEKVTEEMAESVTAGKKSGVQIAGSFQWVGVPLDGYITPLLEMRKAAQLRDGKKSPMDVFTKVVINATYGVICSPFFSDPGASNVVVASNITARARVLAWCMAKGFHLVGTITDGGVGDMSKVLYWTRFSAQGFADASRDIFKDKYRKVRCTVAPLYDVAEWNADIKEGSPEMDRHDAYAWAHLKKTFPKLSIFKYDQFRFETKSMWKEITLHQKANYELVNGEKVVRKYRGLYGALKDTVGKAIFEAVRTNIPILIPVIVPRQLTLNAYNASKEAKTPYTDGKMLYGDTETFTSFQYSHSPVASTQYESVEHHAKVNKRKMKITDKHQDTDINDTKALNALIKEMLELNISS